MTVLPSGAHPSGADLDDLARRVPGQSLMAACLEAQRTEPRRTRAARVFGSDALTPAARSSFVGAQGERLTARMLEALGPEYVVLHSVPVAGAVAAIDHIVIGPGGVVTVGSEYLKDHKVAVAGDSVLVSGRRQELVTAARAEHVRVRRLLDGLALPVARVTTVVAVVGAAHLTVRDAPADVRVLDARRLVRTIQRMPVVLGHDAVWAVAAALTSSMTWTDAGAPIITSEGDEPWIVERFTALERSVRMARAARLSWAAAAVAALAGGLVGLATVAPMLVGAL